jgi:hypothetical protein
VLFQRALLDGLADGSITLTFRRWRRPGALPGSRHRTAIGVIAIDTVEQVADVTEDEARRAGHPSRAALLAELDRYGDGPIYRIALRYAGADPRVELRQRADLDAADLAELRRRLARFDAASRHGAWTVATLRLIAERPGVRAEDLAASVGREKLPFKVDVRKLKELGLTESLEIGYRLSPRGEALLRKL